MKLFLVSAILLIFHAGVVLGGSYSSTGAARAIAQLQSTAGPPVLFNYNSVRSCRQANVGRPPSTPVIVSSNMATGAERKVLSDALTWFNIGISSAMTSKSQARNLATGMVYLANTKAFAKTQAANSESSPVHWQMNLLKNIAIAVNVVDHRNAWGQNEREAVLRWGNSLWNNAKNKNPGWPDTAATFGAAGVLWGAVTKDRATFKRGLNFFDQVIANTTNGGVLDVYFPSRRAKYHNTLPPGWGMRINDKMIGDLVLTAYVGRRIGIDLFNYERKPQTSLYQTVLWWQSVLLADGGKMTKGQDMDFLRNTGQEASWSWTEYFVAIYPTDKATAPLRNRSTSLRRSGYVGLAMGPATCLVR